MSLFPVTEEQRQIILKAKRHKEKNHVKGFIHIREFKRRLFSHPRTVRVFLKLYGTPLHVQIYLAP